MPKLKPEDLDKIGEKIQRTMHLREGKGTARMIVHMGTCGIAAGARPVLLALMDKVETRNLVNVQIATSSCAGLCSREPMMTVEIKDCPPVKYVDLTPEKALEILERHVLGGEIVQEYALASGSERVL